MLLISGNSRIVEFYWPQTSTAKALGANYIFMYSTHRNVKWLGHLDLFFLEMTTDISLTGDFPQPISYGQWQQITKKKSF